MIYLTRLWQFITLAHQGGLLKRWKSLRWHSRLCLFVAVIYVISPVDFLPDVIPILGQLDDIMVITALITFALRLSPVPSQDDEPLTQHAKPSPAGAATNRKYVVNANSVRS